jgi:hypothetical protein
VSHKTVTNQHGLTFRVGDRHRPKQTRASHPHLFRSLGKYGALPTAPEAFDYTTAATVALSMILANGPDPTAPAQVAASGLGDCTSAGAAHIIDAATADAGSPAVITADQAVAFYSLSTGYQLGNENTDQGGDEVTVCQAWQQKGYLPDGSHKIAGWGALSDAEVADQNFVRNVAWLFPLYFGIELADDWLQISGNGFVWDVAGGEKPNPSNGHCVVGLGANAQGIIIDSWGFIGTLTWAAIAQFCTEAAGGNVFAILTPDLINKATQKAPEGFDFVTLTADLDGDVAGNAPAAPTPPAPMPTGPATLANAQAWAAAGIQGGDPLQTQAQAIASAAAGLAAGWPKS